MKIIGFAFTVFLCLVCEMAAQTQLRRSVISSGAVNTSSSSGGIRGTLSQPVVGRTQSKTELSEGFWYRAPKAVSVITIPNSEGEIGTTVTVPVILAASRNLITNGPRDIRVTIRYNKTVLVNKSTYPVVLNGDDALLTITGRITDSVGIIGQVPFLVALGTAEKTQLHIESVEWLNSPFIKTTKTDGEFTVLGICKEGDTVRLIKRGTGTGIIGIAPVPVTENATVTISAGSEGIYKVIIVDAFGREYATLLNERLPAGRHSIALPTEALPSGQYHVVLMNGTQTHSRALVIEK